MSDPQHDECTLYLLDLARADLEGPLAPSVRSHVEVCADCRDWLETYRLVAAVPPEPGKTSACDDNLSSDVLARFAVDPGTLDAVTHDLVSDHLMSCQQCARLVDLCRGALSLDGTVRSADPHVQKRSWLPSSRSRKAVGTVLAAGLTGVALVVSLYFGMGDRHSLEQVLISNTMLRGNQTITATGRITATEAHIGPGSTIILDADEVALGEGFEVGRNAVLVIKSAR